MVLFLLVTQTFYYHFALILSVFSICLVGIYLASENTLAHSMLYQISIDEQRQLKFTHQLINDSPTKSLEINHTLYQILPSSRLSFFGVWLHLSPIKNADKLFQSKKSVIRLFIFRDSLSAKDYACLNQILNLALYP